MKKRVVIAGGGTGGHLYPGIALARALMRHDMNIEISFVGTQKGLEAKVLPREGFKLKTIFLQTHSIFLKQSHVILIKSKTRLYRSSTYFFFQNVCLPSLNNKFMFFIQNHMLLTYMRKILTDHEHFPKHIPSLF